MKVYEIFITEMFMDSPYEDKRVGIARTRKKAQELIETRLRPRYEGCLHRELVTEKIDGKLYPRFTIEETEVY